MDNHQRDLPDRSDMEALVAFLPQLKRNAEPVSEWVHDSGHFPHPIYKSWIEDFVTLAQQRCWCDYDYVQSGGPQMFEDEFIKSASIEQVKTMLTYFVRGERFVDGLRGNLISTGKLLAVVLRLEALLEVDHSSKSG